MKKIISSILLCSALLAGVASCNKNNETQVSDLPQDSGLLAIIVAAQDGLSQTKANASEVADRKIETRINTIQIFVFNEDGSKKETEKYIDNLSSENSSVVTLTSLIGAKRIWAVVNAPRMYLNTESELLTKASNLGDCNSTATGGGLTMVGAAAPTNPENTVPIVAGSVDIGKYTVSDPTSVTTITIPVYRLAARISLEKLTVDFRGTNLEGHSFTVKDIYLKNVVNSCYFNGASPVLADDTNFWSNRIKGYSDNNNWMVDKEGKDIKNLVSDTSLSIACDVSSNGGSGNAMGKYYYVYPNNITTDVRSASWTAPRRTRLVIHAVVNGSRVQNKDTYYVFSIGDEDSIVSGQTAADFRNVIYGNHTYTISNISITMLGKDNDNDDSVPESGKATITVNVEGWGGNTELSYEI